MVVSGTQFLGTDFTTQPSAGPVRSVHPDAPGAPGVRRSAGHAWHEREPLDRSSSKLRCIHPITFTWHRFNVSRTTTARFEIAALDCPAEFMQLDRGLAAVAGIDKLRADYAGRALEVEFDPTAVSREAIVQRIRELGFPVGDGQAVADRREQWRRLMRHATTAVGGLLLAVALLAWGLGWADWLVTALAIASTVVAGFPVARAGLRAARLRALDMHSLMTIAAIGAVATGETLEAATAMFLFGVSLWLESFSLVRARRAVQSLLDLSPRRAHRIVDGGTEDVAPEVLVPGDRVLVRPGERISVDGVIEQGASTVVQAEITGESTPVERVAGDEVYAGTLNGEGALSVRVARPADETLLAHIARLVAQAQSSRSPTQRFVDRFARRYTPAVIVLAVLLASVPPLAARWGWPLPWSDPALPATEWLHRGLVLLVIACPCALVISTPVTLLSGLFHAARRGLLIKGGEHLEQAALIDVVALDKTGTLTAGRPTVLAVESLEGHAADEVLRAAAALEHHSEHPYAAAIAAAASRRGLTIDQARDVVALRGFGVRGQLDGETYFVGSPQLFAQQGLGSAVQVAWLASRAAALDPSAQAVLVGSNSAGLLGAVLLADPLRPDAEAAMAQLRTAGVRRLVLLTGDQRPVAEYVGGRLGVDEVHASLLPQDKLDKVHRLAAEHPHLMVVGDGVNDAPALAAARLGVALGAQASDTALETADVVVMTPHLTRLAELLRLGRRCRRLLFENISLALGIKLATLVLAAAGLATLWMAVAADVGASLVVIANGMRLLPTRGEVDRDQP